MENILKMEFILQGLICMNCAGKIEKQVKNLEGVKTAYIDFSSSKLVIEGDERNLSKITQEAINIVKRIEPDVEVIEKERERAINSFYHKSQSAYEHSRKNNQKKAIKLAIGTVFFGMAAVFQFSLLTEFSLYFISYLLIGGDVLLKAGKNIRRGEIFDENFLMGIATIGAFVIKEFPEGVAVMLFYQIGEFFQNLAVNRSRKSIAALMDIRPDYANKKEKGQLKRVPPEEVNIGDIIIVKPGEKIPVDGNVLAGKSMVDTSPLTGESVPREVEPGKTVLGGFINKNGVLTIKVTKKFGESTVSKILELVENAGSKKAPTENFITKFARYYTPVVVFTAIALAVIPPLVMKGTSFSDWLYRALIFLVVSCPCALVVSIPMGFFGGIGGASKHGILVKGGNYLEALNHIDTVVFDKTGTLTKGVFQVIKVQPAGNISEENLLEYAAMAEVYSNHPVACSIRRAYGKEVNKDEIAHYDEIPGRGIKIKVRGQEIFVGNTKLMDQENIEYDAVEEVGTVVYVAVGGTYAGYLVISDALKEDAANAIKNLRNMGIKKIVMLTGDNQAVAAKVARQLGLDEVYAELLPDQKVELVENLEKQKLSKGKLVFVGDGLNDAPVLARADIGVAMGGLGSDAAIEAADVVLMTDEPSKLGSAIKIAKRTKQIVWQNIIFALGIKGIVLFLGAGGVATMWEAVFADVGVALIAILNAMRVMKADRI